MPKPWRIPVHEAYSEPRISQKLGEDANVDVVSWLAKKTADKFARLYNALDPYSRRSCTKTYHADAIAQSKGNQLFFL